jgi:hypothetical protein
MNQQQFDAFVTRSKDLWESMEAYRLAYVEESELSNRKAQHLRWFTLIAGFVTALGSIPLFLDIQTLKYASAVFGAITGSLTLADKHFRWEESSTEKWKKHKSLEALQKELYHYCLDLSELTKGKDASLHIQQISNKSSDATRLRIEDLDEWKNKARLALESHGFNSISFVHEDHDATEEEFITDEVQGIEAVSRGGI